jgi:16S rRNA (cytosine967-C5)-methyltransferase
VSGRKAAPNGRVTSAREGRAGPESVRTAAVWIVERTLASRSPMDAFLAGVAQGFDERDQGLLKELVLGTLRWLKLLDHVLVTASGRRLEQIQADLLGVLRVAVYQLLFLDRVPAHAIVSEAVDQAHRRSHRAAANFVNAVLRRIARDPALEAWPVRIDSLADRLAVETSHPEILVRRWLEQFGEPATRALLDASNRQKPMHLLAFRGKGGRELLAERLIDEGIEVEPSRLSPLGLIVRDGQPLRTQAFRRGDFYVQDEAAQAAALVPKPRPGELVLDAAAAPGGKGLALLAAEPSVALVAADISLPRLATLAANHRRISAGNGGGSRTSLAGASSTEPPFRDGFDRVIVDYPCSGTGTLRKHPELKWRFSLSELARLADQALAMMSGAALAVKRGGILVAISCSLEQEENEMMGRRLLERRPELARLPIADVSPGIEIPGAISGESMRIPTADDHDGFTVQLFVRRK